MAPRGEVLPTNVIDLAAYRRGRAVPARNTNRMKQSSGTNLRLEITSDGHVLRHPLEIHPAHALAVVAWCTEITARALDVHTSAT